MGPRTTRAMMDTARMAAEIPAATAITLAHRLPAIAAGAFDPRRRDDADLRRMVAEKVEAGRDSTAAARKGIVAAGAVLSQGLRGQARAAGALGKAGRGKAGRGGGGLPSGFAAFAGASMALALGLAQVGAETTRAMLAPAHRKVTGNARRFSRKAKTKPRT